MTAADWHVLIQDVAMVISSVFIPIAVLIYNKNANTKITDQERAAVQASVNTAAGILQTQLDQGAVHLQDITPTSAVVTAAAISAQTRVEAASISQGTTTQTFAEKIVAAVNTSPPAVIVAPQQPVQPPQQG